MSLQNLLVSSPAAPGTTDRTPKGWPMVAKFADGRFYGILFDRRDGTSNVHTRLRPQDREAFARALISTELEADRLLTDREIIAKKVGAEPAEVDEMLKDDASKVALNALVEEAKQQAYLKFVQLAKNNDVAGYYGPTPSPSPGTTYQEGCSWAKVRQADVPQVQGVAPSRVQAVPGTHPAENGPNVLVVAALAALRARNQANNGHTAPSSTTKTKK